MDYVIAFAAHLESACQGEIQKLVLPNLMRFVRQARLLHTDAGDEWDAAWPHERVLGLTDDIVVTPCHWTVGIDRIRMDEPLELQLTSHDSKIFLEAVRPYFAEDGIELAFAAPLVWRVTNQTSQSDVFKGFSLASLDRVIGRTVDAWQAATAESQRIRRLQNEVQMLLYTHPVNAAREARGLLAVNSFWLSRAVNAPAAGTVVYTDLRQTALRGDWHAWTNAWQILDAKLDAQLTAIDRITLCGERHAQAFALSPPLTWQEKVQRFIRRPVNIQHILQNL